MTAQQVELRLWPHHDKGRQSRGCSREEAQGHDSWRLRAPAPQELLGLLHLLPQRPRLPLASLCGRLCSFQLDSTIVALQDFLRGQRMHALERQSAGNCTAARMHGRPQGFLAHSYLWQSSSPCVVPVAMLTARVGLVGWGGEGRGLFFSPLDCQGSRKAPLLLWLGLGAFTGSPACHNASAPAV